MAATQLDDTLEELPPAPASEPAPAQTAPAPPAAAPRSIYDDILEREDQSGQQRLRTAVVQAADTTPDRAAQIQRLSEQTGVSSDIIDRNFDDIKKRAQYVDTPYAQMQRETPAVAAWAAAPQNAAVASDDLPHLGNVEGVVSIFTKAIAQANAESDFAGYRTRELMGEVLSPADKAKMATADVARTQGGDLSGGSWFGGVVTQTGKLLQFISSAAPYSLGGAAVGAVVGAGLGVPGGPPGILAGAYAGASTGFEMGGAVGLARTAFETTAGPAYDKYLAIRDTTGHPIDPSVARAAAITEGVINGALMGQIPGAKKLLGLASQIPGVDRLTTAALGDAMTQALQQPTVRAALAQMMKGYTGALTHGTALMVAQEAVSIVGSELAKATATVRAPAATPDYGYGTRYGTTTPKGLGFLGPLQRPDGTVMSELSVGVQINGKETEVPAIVPTLSKAEVAQLLTAGDGPLPPAIVAKAQAFAEQRLAAGKDPFASPGEQQNLYPELARAPVPADTSKAVSFAHITPNEAAAQLWHATTSALQSLAVVSAAHPALGFMHDVARARQAAAGPVFFEALKEGIEQSKTAERLPSAMRALVAQAAEQGGVKTLYQPLDTWDSHWKGLGIDPRAMAEKITGDPKAYDLAKQTGTDLPIQTADYATKLSATDHDAYFRNELRLLGPDSMNAREAYALAEEVRKTPPPTADAGDSPTRAAVLEQLTKAGLSRDVAGRYADLFSSATGEAGVFGSGGGAGRAGVDVSDFFKQYGLKVERPVDAPALTGEGAPAASAVVQAPLEALGTEPPATATFLGHGPDGPLYNVHGGPSDRSTLTAAGLEKLGIAIPETPPDTGDRPNGQEIRQRVIDARAKAAMPVESDVDRAVREGQAGTSSASAPATAAVPTPVDTSLDANAAAKAEQERDSLPTHYGTPVEDLVANLRRAGAEQPEREVVILAAEAGRDRVGSKGTDEATAHEPGQVAGDRDEERARADQTRLAEAGGDERVAERGGVQAAAGGPERAAATTADAADARAAAVFVRRPLTDNAARLTFEVLRELAHIKDELETFPFEPVHWEHDVPRLTGNAGGGHSQKTPARGGAPVYDDVLGHSPVNQRKVKGELVPAADVHGSRADVINAITKTIESGDIATNLAEGAVRVAERRALGDWKGLEKPWLPRSWAEVASREFTGALSDAIDAGLRPEVDLLDARSLGDESDIIEPEGGGDTSFNIDEFSQSLFDDLEPPDPAADSLTEKPAGDVLDTGEVQSRLPGDTGAVRDQNVPTPELEVPFSLTSTIAKPGKGKQTTLFQEPRPSDEGLHAVGSDEERQGYAWGRYEPSLRDVSADPSTLLEWDKPAREQSPAVQEKLRALGVWTTDATGREVYAHLEQQHAPDRMGPDRQAQAEAASASLRAGGIAGIHYTDGGLSNYVVFDDTLAKITSYDQSPVPLDKDNVAAWADEVKQRAGPDLQGFEISLNRLGDLFVESLVVARGAQRAGLGSATMQELTRFADLNGKRIALTPAHTGDIGTGEPTSRGRLVKFYKRFGFVENKGRNYDPALTAGMYREPTLRGDLGQPIEPRPAPVATLTGKELGEGLEDVKDLRRAGLAYYATELQHGLVSVDRPGFGTVTFTNKGKEHIKWFSANPDKLRLIPAIPAVIERGDYLGRTDVHKSRSDDFVAFHRFEGSVGLGDRLVRLKVLVGEDSQGNKFYDLDPVRETTQESPLIQEGDPGPPEGGKTTLTQSMESGADDVNLTILPQGDAAPPARRGSIRFGTDRQFSINLLERADLSTFLHETGHFFLEVFGDLHDKLASADPTTLSDSQKGVVADYRATLEQLGATSRDALTTEHHETFARQFEAYLMEGKAPSLELQSTFSRFRAWLIGVYRSLDRLNVRLTPQVRAVMDRLLASDQAISDADARRGVPQMFTTPESAGMSAADFSLYTATVADASRKAHEELDAKLLADVHREQTRQWKAQRAEVKQQVTTETDADPTQRALAAITKGTQPDGSPLTEGLETPPLQLSREAVGADRAKRLRRGVIAAEGGLDPATVAELYGFGSADALLTALEQAPKRAEVIDRETQRRMIQQYGDTLLDGTLHDKAQLAAANEDRDLVIRAEMRALGQLRRTVAPFVAAEAAKGSDALAAAGAERAYERRWLEAESKLRVAIAEGRKQVEIDALTDEVRNLRQKARGGAATIRAGIPPAAVLKEAARVRIESTVVRELTPGPFWSASRRAAQQAIDKAARQDYAGAITAKTQELVNLALYRAAEGAKEEVETRVASATALDRPGTRKTIGLAGGGFLDQIDGILDRFGFSKADQNVLDRKAAVAAWQTAKQADGVPLDLPPSVLNGEFRKPYKDLTLGEFRDVSDALKQLEHLARAESRTFKNAATDAFRVERDGLVASIRANNVEHKLPLEFGKAENRKLSIGDYLASLTKLSILARGLDGSVDGGPMWESFIRRFNEASDAEQTRNAATGEKMSAIFEEHYPGRERMTLSQRGEVRGVGSMSKEMRLAIALNWGTEAGQDRLLSDPVRKLTREQIETVLGTLDRRDWHFVQDTWKLIGSFWPEIAAKQERVVGVAPEQVAGTTIHTRYGDVDGAYYPLKYDGRLASRAVQLELAGVAKLQQGAAYVRSTTQRGFVETRLTHVELPIRLELGVAFQHLGQVIHDLTHHEMLIDATRLLRDKGLSSAIYETQGSSVYKQFTAAVQDIATGLAPATETLARGANFLRTGMQIASLGYNLNVGFKHPFGVFNGAAYIGPEWMMKGIGRWVGDAAHQIKTTDWIKANSPMMADRGHTATVDLHDLAGEMRTAGGWFDALVRTVSADHITQQTITNGYLWHIGLLQQVADVPTWLGGYEKAMDAQRRAGGEVDETRAFRLADQAVLDSQGGGTVKDLARIQRGGPYARLFMTFYSYGARVFNSTAEAAGKTEFRSPASVIKFLGNLSLIYLMPAMANAAVRQMSGTVKKGEDAATSFVVDAGKDMLGAALNGLVGIRELSGPILYGRDYTGPAGTQFFQVMANAIKQVKQEELDEPLEKSLNDVFGVLLHYPASQVDRTVAGWEALRDGRTDNPLALLSGGPAKPKK